MYLNLLHFHASSFGHKLIEVCGLYVCVSYINAFIVYPILIMNDRMVLGECRAIQWSNGNGGQVQL